MRCLSIREPWLALILQGWKTIEVRSWTHGYRGLVALHSSRTLDRPNLQWFRSQGFIDSWGPVGHIMGVADLMDVYRGRGTQKAEMMEAMTPPWGEYCWKFGSIWRLVEPIPLKGQLGLYTLPKEVEARLVVGDLVEPISVKRKQQMVKAWR